MLQDFKNNLIARMLPGKNGHLQKIGVNMIWLLFDKFVRYGLALFIGIWLARYLGKEGFGVINNALAFVTLFTGLYTLGIDSIVVKEMTTFPEKRAALLGTSLILRLIGSLLTMIICLVYHYIYSDPLFFKVILITSFMPLFQIFEITDFYFQSVTRSKMTVMAKFVGLIAVLTLRIIFIVNHASIYWFAIANIAEFIATSFATIYIYQKHVKDLFDWKYNQELAKKILHQSWPLALSALGSFAYFKMGQIQLGDLVGRAAAGIFAAGIKFSEFWYFIPTMIFISVYPHLIETKQKSEALFNSKLLKIHLMMVWISLSIACAIYLMAPRLIHFSFGDGYQESVDVLRIHIWSGIFIFISASSQIWYLANGLTKLVIFNNILGAVSNITLNYMLIPKFGTLGACYSCFISFMICNLLASAVLPASRPLFLQLIKAFNPLNLKLLFQRF